MSIITCTNRPPERVHHGHTKRSTSTFGSDSFKSPFTFCVTSLIPHLGCISVDVGSVWRQWHVIMIIKPIKVSHEAVIKSVDLCLSGTEPSYFIMTVESSVPSAGVKKMCIVGSGRQVLQIIRLARKKKKDLNRSWHDEDYGRKTVLRV